MVLALRKSFKSLFQFSSCPDVGKRGNAPITGLINISQFSSQTTNPICSSVIGSKSWYFPSENPSSPFFHLLRVRTSENEAMHLIIRLKNIFKFSCQTTNPIYLSVVQWSDQTHHGASSPKVLQTSLTFALHFYLPIFLQDWALMRNQTLIDCWRIISNLLTICCNNFSRKGEGKFVSVRSPGQALTVTGPEG